MWIFQRLDCVSDNYHPGGGAVIVANDEADARALVSESATLSVKDGDWATAIVYDVESSERRVFIFPDAGCC
jgi:hypothetical protein